ncbi:phage shock protein operon transcriptional activator [Dongia soli]|uniref:Phage shock protein operon transcriptional activator n=1 Tax=Dongia soli TaxID=600628 RepID=A0ABU5E9H0_9PROT|nr:phage shock protein operon transcriptional activator [Dongia soli]MDY0883000.1 phage shock protein operon transcriptional activator [Dongia soli]
MNETPLGESLPFTTLLGQVSVLAQLDRTVLLVGERGTGKELIAERLHYLSPRWDRPLIKVNCAALGESLLDSELFGHEAGAFTGAVKRRAGRFERADGGTLFLDEIASASLAVQEKLLRVIEYGEYERLGASETLHADIRLVAATNVDLPALAAAGKFRADLLDRLAFAVVTVPPLRARQEDILVLAQHFGLVMSTVMKRPYFAGFTKIAEKALLAYAWPGNVRELKNVVERAVAATDADKPVNDIRFDPFDSPWRPGADTSPQLARPPAEPDGPYNFTVHMAEMEKRLLIDALERNLHQQKRTAAFLGLEYHQLRNLMRKYGLIGPRQGDAHFSPRSKPTKPASN